MRGWITSALAVSLLGLALHVTVTEPASAQTPHAQRNGPSTGSGDASDRAPGPQQDRDNSEADRDREKDSTVPGADGCPYFQRKLQLIV